MSFFFKFSRNSNDKINSISDYNQFGQGQFGQSTPTPQQAPYNPHQQPLPTDPQQMPFVAGQNQFTMFQQPIVQDMAMQYGQKLADQGREMVNKEFEKYIPVTKLKYYFAVDNKYVINKLRLLFFPFTHRVSLI